MFGIGVLIILYFEAKIKGDFAIFYAAASDILKEKNIYATLYNEWYHYYYSVLFAVFLSPFTLLSVHSATFIWLIANVYFLYRSWMILRFFSGIGELQKKVRFWLTVLIFLFMARFIRDNLHLAQMTICMLYLSLEGLFQMHRKKYRRAGFLIALGINIKLMPVFLIPYLAYRAEWKTLLSTLAFIAVLAFVPVLFIGWDYHFFLLTERWNLINPLNNEHILDVSERSFHSITTWLSTLLVADAGNSFTLPLRRNILDIELTLLHTIINCVRLLFVLFTLYFLKGLPFRKMRNRLHMLYEASYILILIPLLFPHQQHYAFYFIFPAISYLAYYMYKVFIEQKDFSSSRRTFLAILLITSYLLTNANLIIGHFHQYYDHFKILTYGIFLIIITLSICRPRHIAQGNT